MQQITRPKTIVCDIDGVIFEHTGNITKQHLGTPVVLPGVLDQFKQWDIEGCNIILMTGRRESVRQETERQLTNAGIFYDTLIMGVGGGVRVLVNDKKPDGVLTTQAYCLKRNEGLAALGQPEDKDRDNFIPKPWGSETLIETNDKYTVKKLFMKKGHRCSTQYHEIKHETIYVLGGVMRLWFGSDVDALDYVILTPGDTYVVPTGLIHSMEAMEDCYYLESSTSELDDVVRLKDEYGRA